ncbi:MAG: hypothetical protein AABX30_00520 [Nanoarchaeota archaeon]
MKRVYTVTNNNLSSTRSMHALLADLDKRYKLIRESKKRGYVHAEYLAENGIEITVNFEENPLNKSAFLFLMKKGMTPKTDHKEENKQIQESISLIEKQLMEDKLLIFTLI